MTRQQRIAHKAVATRQLRQATHSRLESKYGYVVADVVMALETGKNPYEAAGMWNEYSVPAIKAHYTRGTYNACL